MHEAKHFINAEKLCKILDKHASWKVTTCIQKPIHWKSGASDPEMFSDNGLHNNQTVMC